MKTCSRCGRQNDDSIMFCGSCGLRLPENVQYQSFASYNTPSVSQFTDNPVVRLVKTIGSSAFYITALVFYTIYVILQLVSAFIPSDLGEFINYMEDLTGESFGNLSSGSSITYSIIALIPSFLICLGMWMFYAAAKKPNTQYNSKAGLTVIKVVQIVILTLITLLVAILLLLVNAFNEVAIDFDLDLNFDSDFIIPFTVITLIVYVCFLFYYIGIIKTISTVGNALTNGIPSGKVSTFVMVINFIIAILSLIGAGLFLYLELYDFLDFFTALFNSAFLITISLLMGSYQEKVSRLLHNIPDYNHQPQFTAPEQGYNQNLPSQPPQFYRPPSPPQNQYLQQQPVSQPQTIPQQQISQPQLILEPPAVSVVNHQTSPVDQPIPVQQTASVQTLSPVQTVESSQTTTPAEQPAVQTVQIQPTDSVPQEIPEPIPTKPLEPEQPSPLKLESAELGDSEQPPSVKPELNQQANSEKESQTSMVTEKPAFCENCGNKFESDKPLFCSNCGHKR